MGWLLLLSLLLLLFLSVRSCWWWSDHFCIIFHNLCVPNRIPRIYYFTEYRVLTSIFNNQSKMNRSSFYLKSTQNWPFSCASFHINIAISLPLLYQALSIVLIISQALDSRNHHCSYQRFAVHSKEESKQGLVVLRAGFVELSYHNCSASNSIVLVVMEFVELDCLTTGERLELESNQNRRYVWRWMFNHYCFLPFDNYDTWNTTQVEWISQHKLCGRTSDWILNV